MAVDKIIVLFPISPMTKGRPVSWNIFGKLDPGAWTQLVELDARGRLSLPSAVRSRLAWFDSIEGGLLATIDTGHVELSSWSDFGPRVLESVKERIGHVPLQSKGQLAVAAMDRYMRLSVEKPARIVLPLDLRHHLGCLEVSVARVVVLDGTLTLWSEANWCQDRAKRLTLLTG